MSIIEKVLSPITSQEFLANYWPQKHLVVHGNIERWDPLFRLQEIMDLEKILSMYKSMVMVVGKPVIEASEGIADRFMVTPDKAIYWYERGAALEFDFFDMWLPKVAHSLDKIKKELGLIEGATSKLVMYAAKNGGGFKAHFDAYANFVFQLKGKKNWKLMHNSNVTNPTQHYDLAEAPFLPEELAAQWRGEFPDETLSGAELVELAPGSMLFLPRGYWHATQSNEETLSLNITLTQPTWLDLFLADLRIRLSGENALRELVQEADVEPIVGLIHTLAEKMLEVKSADLLARGKNELDLYQQTQYVFRQAMKI